MKEKKACKECPFNRKNVLEKHKALGGSDPGVYIGQIHGPFWLPCHLDREYKDKNSDPAKVHQCAGAAVFRANIGVDALMPEQMLRLPLGSDPNVFTSVEEFISHYMECSMEAAAELNRIIPPWMLRDIEMQKAEVKVYEPEIDFRK
jgi:hypothetical protein